MIEHTYRVTGLDEYSPDNYFIDEQKAIDKLKELMAQYNRAVGDYKPYLIRETSTFSEAEYLLDTEEWTDEQV